ncbi:MAG: MurR/RpiR family transcriptional regulator [Aestuariivirga sp.]
MSVRLSLRIQERYDKLSRAEQKLARLILERKDDILTYSATEMADMAEVSKATAARLFRSLGYAGFEEVREQSREERNRTEPYRYSAASQEQSKFGQSISAYLDLEIANLIRTFEELRPDRLRQAAELIKEAPRVWFLGLGVEEGIARHGRLLLSRLRHDVMQIGLHQSSWAEDLAMTGPRDALIVISLKPRPRVLRPILDYAKTTRVNTIMIADQLSLAWSQKYAKAVLPCHVASHGLGPSYTSISSVIRLLAVAYAERAGEPAAQRLEMIAEIHEELDDTE